MKYVIPAVACLAISLAASAHAQTYVGEATFPDINYSETFFPTDPDTGSQIEVTCSGTSSVNYSDMVVTLSPSSMQFTINGSRTGVTGTDSRFCADSDSSFPFQVANVIATGSGVSGQNNGGTIFIDLLFNSGNSELAGTVNNTQGLAGQQIGQANLTLAPTTPITYDISFTEDDDSRNTGAPPTGSFTYDAATETLTGLVISYQGIIFDEFGDELVYFEGGNCGAGDAGLFALLSKTCGVEGSYTYRASINPGVAFIDICKDCSTSFGNGNLSGEVFLTGLEDQFFSSGTWDITQREGDTDGDGVDDGSDLCPATLVGELVDSNGCVATQAIDLVFSDIFTLIDSPVSDKARNKLSKAQDKLGDALAELDEGDIKKALKKVGDAVKELTKAGKEGADVEDLIDQLVELARAQAKAAIDEAIAAGGDLKEIDKALKEFGKAQDELAKSMPDKSIDKYAKAWDHANKALP